MKKNKVVINQSLTIYKLLESYPELEDYLISLAPLFKKLKNPFLRKTVAKIATIKQASSVGNIPLKVMINKLRTAVGQPINEVYDEINYFVDKPIWFIEDKIVVSISEQEIENKNQMTLEPILASAKNIKNGEIIELITTFLPAPEIDVMKSKGYSTWTTKKYC